MMKEYSLNDFENKFRGKSVNKRISLIFIDEIISDMEKSRESVMLESI